MSLAMEMLEKIRPARTAEPQPIEMNPFDKARADFERIQRELIVKTDELEDTGKKLLSAYQENEALQARYDRDVTDYRRRDSEARAEVNALGRSMVELATQVQAIGGVLQSAISLTLKANEIVQRFQDKFKEEIEAEGLEDQPDIGETLRRLPEPDYR